MEAVTLIDNPLIFNENKLNVSLEKLNNELSGYKIRVDSLDDIYIDREASGLNQGDVVKIQAVYTNPDDEFDEKLFFSGYRELEDKFESLPDVYSAQFDEGDLILTLVLNKKGVDLNKTLEAGGATGDASITAMVDKQLNENAAEVFNLVGIAPPTSDDDALIKVPMARQKAIEHYSKIRPKSLFVFYNGRKMDISSGAGMNVLPLQQELTKRLYEVMGSKLSQPDHALQTQYANNKAILAIDMLRGMASAPNPNQPVFNVTDELLDQVVSRVQEG